MPARLFARLSARLSVRLSVQPLVRALPTLAAGLALAVALLARHLAPVTGAPVASARADALLALAVLLGLLALRRALGALARDHAYCRGLLLAGMLVGPAVPFLVTGTQRRAEIRACLRAPLNTPLPPGAQAARAADSTRLADDVGLAPAEIGRAFTHNWWTPGRAARAAACVQAQPALALLDGGWRVTLHALITGTAPAPVPAPTP